MSNKQQKMADWTDYIGGSQMPNDELTFTDASTYGLQGFQFDTEMGTGPADGARLPETRGLSGLPDGFVQATEEGLDLRSMAESEGGPDLNFMLSEEEGALPVTEQQRKEASIQNLDWLDPTQEQDPNRLPENPTNRKPDLENQWTRRRVDVFSLVPNRDKEIAEYERSISEGPRSGLPGQKVAAIKEAVLKAIRQVHYGVSMHEIKSDLIAAFNGDAVQARKAINLVEADQGLAGKVFVRASAFPGVKNGKWVEELKKVARTARYVITNDETIANHLGMTMVDEVPWGEALEHYRPLLAAAGYKVASQGNAKEILRRAFLLGSSTPEADSTFKPQGYLMPEPKKGYDASTSVKSAEEQAREKKMRAAHIWIARKVKEGKLSQEDALRLHEASLKPGVQDVQILKAASDLLTASGDTPVYEGVGTHLSQDAQVARQKVWASLSETREVAVGMKDDVLRKAQLRLVKAVKTGSLTKGEAQTIASLAKNATELERLIAAAIQAAPTMRQHPSEPIEVRAYQGTVQKEAVQESANVPQMTGEVNQMLRWARLQMNEGLSGDKLTATLGARFSAPLLQAGEESIRKLRKAHEGLAGHLYVDAKAYASKDGFTGCDEGASKHRTSSVKFVLAMSRCASCVFANADGFCQKYNKKLANEISAEDKKAFRKAALKKAEAGQEVPVTSFDPQEFALHNGALDGVEVNKDTHAEPLSDVSFGGMQLE